MTLTHAVLAVFVYVVFVFGCAWHATRPAKPKRGSVRIVCHPCELDPYQVQRYEFWGWKDVGSPRGKEAHARQWVEHLIEQERLRRNNPVSKVIAEYEP